MHELPTVCFVCTNKVLAPVPRIVEVSKNAAKPYGCKLWRDARKLGILEYRCVSLDNSMNASSRGVQVDSLQYATLATVSRCGMVWFSAEEDNMDDESTDGNGSKACTVSNDMLLRHKVSRTINCSSPRVPQALFIDQRVG